jgi:hypothetical protein
MFNIEQAKNNLVAAQAAEAVDRAAYAAATTRIRNWGESTFFSAVTAHFVVLTVRIVTLMHFRVLKCSDWSTKPTLPPRIGDAT